MVAVAPGALQAPAGAAPPAGCTPDNGDYASTAIGEDVTFPNADQARGTSGDLRVPGSGAVCQRITSIYVFEPQPADGQMEFGVVLGYSSCTDTFYSTPRAFYVARSTNNVPHCNTLTAAGAMDGDQYDDFRVLNKDNDGKFRSAWQGTVLQPNGVQLGFNQGTSFGGTERGESGDGCTARWANLEEWRALEAWSPWDNLVRNGNSYEGPDCHFTRESDDTAKVTP